jgi:predicted DNA-binding transcriptional regulator AlpA
MEDRMLNIRQVRDKLGLSYAEVIRLVQTGRLRAYRYAGTGPVARDTVETDTRGLRFRDSDIEAMLEESLVN